MLRPVCFAVAFCAAAGPFVSAQSPYATQVVSYTQGTGGGIFLTDNVLGGPRGAGLGSGSLHVLTIGAGGSLTLGFDVTICDGPGADFTAFENGFLFGPVFGGSVFAECAFVEVSTNGVDFARFPVKYYAPTANGTPMGSLAGLCGGMPVLANVLTNTISPFDPVVSGGESFDLADLAQDPLVVAGVVDLQAIHFIRFADVVAGVDLDVNGKPIPGGATADLDAVAVLHHTAEPAGGPVCDFWIDAAGILRWRLGDPDGFMDLDVGSLASFLNLQPFDPFELLSYFLLVSFDGQVAEAVLAFPLDTISNPALPLMLAASIGDLTGNRAGDQVALQR